MNRNTQLTVTAVVLSVALVGVLLLNFLPLTVPGGVIFALGVILMISPYAALFFAVSDPEDVR